MIRLESDALEARVKASVHEIIESADALRDSGELLDEFADLSPHADADQLRQVSLGVRALALQALTNAAAVLAISERLATLGFVREHHQDE